MDHFTHILEDAEKGELDLLVPNDLIGAIDLLL